MSTARKKPSTAPETKLREALHHALQIQDRLWWMVAELLTQLTVLRRGSSADLEAEVQAHFEHTSMLVKIALKGFAKLPLPVSADEKYASDKRSRSTVRRSNRIRSITETEDIDVGQVARQQRIVKAVVHAAEDIHSGVVKKGAPLVVKGSDSLHYPAMKPIHIVMLDTDDDVALAAPQTRLFETAEEDFELWKLIFLSDRREDILTALVAAVRTWGKRTVRDDKERANLRATLTKETRRKTKQGQRLPTRSQEKLQEAVRLILGEAPSNARSLEPR